MIPDEALKAALEAVQNETYGASYSRDLFRIALTAAAPLLRAQALEDAADELAIRSETFLKTMQNMADSREYKLEDIVRYGAFSAEANTTACRLRARAVTERGGA